jgi:uncharacterized membrane protein
MQPTPTASETQIKEPYKKPYTMEANVEAALSYLITPITGILVFIMEKDNKFVRFHAFQSILFGVVSMGALSISESLKVILIGFILKQALSVLIALAWFYLMWQAYNDIEYELPFLGKIAKDQVYKHTA